MKPWEEYQNEGIKEPKPWSEYGGASKELSGAGASGSWASHGTSGGWGNQKDELEWSDAISSGIKNIPASTWREVMVTASAVTSPIQTLKGMGSVLRGATGWDPLKPPTDEDRHAWEGLKSHYANKYGTVEGFKKAVAKEPMEIISDALVFLPAVGGAATAAKLPKVAKAAHMAQRLDPLNVAYQAAALPARALGATGLPQRMYTGVVKPTKRMTRADRDAMFKRAVELGVVPKEGGKGRFGPYGGLETVQEARISKADEISRAVQDAEAAGGQVYRDTALSKALPSVEKDWSRPQRAQTARQVKEYMEDYPEVISPTRAQKAKVDIGQELKDSEYGKQSLGRKAVQKDFRRGLKLELERLYPDLKGLNVEYAEMKNLESALDDAVKRIQNTQLMGLGDTAATAANPVFAIKAALGIPQVKSRLAIALARARSIPKYGRLASPKLAAVRASQREDTGR